MIDSLVLNVRHRAWLSVVPNKQEQTRWQKYSATGSPVADLPDVEEAEYLITYLLEVGPVNQSGMGPAPISYSEIRDWSEITGTRITEWDAHMLRHLSRIYVNEYNDAKDPSAPAPYEEAMTMEQRRQSVVAGFKSMARSNNG